MQVNIYHITKTVRSDVDKLSDEYSDVVAIRCENRDLIIEQSNREMIPIGERFTDEEFEEYVSAECTEETNKLLNMTEHEIAEHFKNLQATKEEFMQKMLDLHS